jgi:hypothetical protein
MKKLEIRTIKDVDMKIDYDALSLSIVESREGFWIPKKFLIANLTTQKEFDACEERLLNILAALREGRVALSEQ